MAWTITLQPCVHFMPDTGQLMRGTPFHLPELMLFICGIIRFDLVMTECPPVEVWRALEDYRLDGVDCQPRG